MELRPSLSPKLIQKLRLTPQLKQAIHILQLNITELRELAEQEFEENPILELEEPLSNEEIDLDEILDQDQLSYYMPNTRDSNIDARQEKQRYLESLATKGESLQENLLKQLHLNFSEEKDIKIGENIIGNINDDGYLEIGTKEIAEKLNSNEKEIERVLKTIQNFYPPGVGARDLKESLLIQLKNKGYSEKDLIYKIVSCYLEDLEKGKLEKISKSLDIDREKLSELLKEIAYLEPKCGREFLNERVSFVYPDLIIKRNEETGEYEIEFSNDFFPTLKVSNYYKKLLKDPSTPEKTKKYLKDKLASALWLIQAINQRQNTILKIANSLVKYQKDFLEKGEGYLKPLNLKEIAKEIEMSESTVSRATSGKFISTPHGVIELKEFFSREIDNTSVDKIKHIIISLIEKEPPHDPLTDSQITKLLKHKGIDIARRTVAKYREDLKILPSHLRAKK